MSIRRVTGANATPLMKVVASPGVRKLWTPGDWAANPATRDYYEYVRGTGVRSGVSAALKSSPGPYKRHYRCFHFRM